jgi:hypothetical protein
VLLSPALPGLEGDEVASEQDDGKMAPVRDAKRKGERKDRSVGDALRAVYNDAVSESVPDEMLDLLKKLG